MFSFKEIGPIMRKARKQNKMTIKQVSELTGINADTISDLEHGKTNMKVFTLLDELVKIYHIRFIPEESDEKFISKVAGRKKLSSAARQKITQIILEDRKKYRNRINNHKE